MSARLSLCALMLGALSSTLQAGPLDSPEAVVEAARQSGALLEAGRYPEAESVLRQGLEMARRFNLDDDATAPLWNNLGTYYQDLGRCQEAETSFRHALRAWQRTGHPLLVRTAVNLGSLLLGCDNLGGADRHWNTVIAPLVSRLPEHDPDLRVALVLQGELLYAHRKYAAAEPILERARGLWESSGSPADIRTAPMWNSLSLVHTKLGRYDEAIRDQQRTIAAVERAHGPNHPLLAKLYANLGVAYYLVHRPEEAERSCRKALDIAAAGFGPDDPVTAGIMLTHSALLRKSNRKVEAEAEKRAARAILLSSSRTRGQTVDVSSFQRH